MIEDLAVGAVFRRVQIERPMVAGIVGHGDPFGVPENRLDRAFDVACFPILGVGGVLALALSLAVPLPLLQYASKRQELTGSLSKPEVVATVVQAEGFLEVVRKRRSDRFLKAAMAAG